MPKIRKHAKDDTFLPSSSFKDDQITLSQPARIIPSFLLKRNAEKIYQKNKIKSSLKNEKAIVQDKFGNNFKSEIIHTFNEKNKLDEKYNEDNISFNEEPNKDNIFIKNSQNENAFNKNPSPCLISSNVQCVSNESTSHENNPHLEEENINFNCSNAKDILCSSTINRDLLSEVNEDSCGEVKLPPNQKGTNASAESLIDTNLSINISPSSSPFMGSHENAKTNHCNNNFLSLPLKGTNLASPVVSTKYDNSQKVSTALEENEVSTPKDKSQNTTITSTHYTSSPQFECVEMSLDKDTEELLKEEKATSDSCKNFDINILALSPNNAEFSQGVAKDVGEETLISSSHDKVSGIEFSFKEKLLNVSEKMENTGSTTLVSLSSQGNTSRANLSCFNKVSASVKKIGSSSLQLDEGKTKPIESTNIDSTEDFTDEINFSPQDMCTKKNYESENDSFQEEFSMHIVKYQPFFTQSEHVSKTAEACSQTTGFLYNNNALGIILKEVQNLNQRASNIRREMEELKKLVLFSKR